MRKTRILIITIMTIMTILLLTISSYAGEIESKPGTTVWTNITAHNAYIYCQNMKSQTSSIGTGNLNPHMSTAKDWDAVSVLAISQYGSCTSSTSGTTYTTVNGYYSTTTNASGVMNWGRYNAQNGVTPYYAFTGSFMTIGTNDSRRTALYENRNSVFVNPIYGGDARLTQTGETVRPIALGYRNNAMNKGMGIIQASEGEFANETGGLGQYQYWGYSDANNPYYFYADTYPILAKRDLFGFYVGTYNGWRGNRGRCVCLHNL